MIAVLVVTLALAGCGGDSGCGKVTGGASGGTGSTGTCGTAPGGGTPPPASANVASLTVASGAASIPADGSSSATITVLAKDANNNALSGVAVTLSASSGTLSGAAATTGTNGTITASLAAGGTSAGTTITVTATSGSVSGKATVTVVATQQTITLLTSSPQMPSDNSKPTTIRAIVQGANKQLLSGVVVNFQASSGAIVPTQTVAGAGANPAVLAGMTDANGEADASLTTPGDPTNRTITVTASAGSATAQVAISVTGTTLTLSGPTNLVLNNSGTCTVILTNSAGQGIPNTTVTLSSANGNTLSAPTLVTDANGRGSFTVKAAKGGTDTITASGLGLTQTLSVAVSSQSFNISAPANGTKVTLGTSQTVTATWVNNGAPVVGQAVTFAATRGTLVPSTPVTTDANGNASVSISSTSAGPSIVQATGSGVSAQLNLDFVALAPSQISVQAGPAAVAVQGQSTITALVRDAANNLVEGATVNFQVTTDPTNGGLSAASATTDAQGRAQTVYTAGNSTSGANGVTITATVGGTTITSTTTLTVGGQAVFLSLGTGNSIDVNQGVAIYQVTYTVFAVDSHGAALPNVPITVSVLPVAYGKGVMGGCPGTTWSPVYSTATTDAFSYKGAKMCVNEDTDYTGNINSLGIVGGHPVKDYNNNGKLDPGNVAVASPSSGMTDANGRFDVKVTYPRDHSYWVEVTLVASTTVSGTQSSTSSTFVLQGAVGDYACSTGPPGPVSPYGVANTCANAN